MFFVGSVILVVKNGEEIALKHIAIHFLQTRSIHLTGKSKRDRVELHFMMFRTMFGVVWLSLLSYQGDIILFSSSLLSLYK
jgi:hypothetical protein